MSKSSDHNTRLLLSPGKGRARSYGSTHAAVNASVSTISSSSLGDDAEGGRVWIMACFSLIACLSALLTGMTVGYSSATLIELKSVFLEGDATHGFLDTSTYASLFGVTARML